MFNSPGGTAGCIVASRLADASPELSILVVESGRNNHNDPDIVHPPFFHNNLTPDKHKLVFYKANKAPQLAGREPIVSTGGLLGGGSSVNAMMYTRAQRCDFDSWDTPGWSADDMWPFLKKVMRYHDSPLPICEALPPPRSIRTDGERSSKHITAPEPVITTDTTGL